MANWNNCNTCNGTVTISGGNCSCTCDDNAVVTVSKNRCGGRNTCRCNNTCGSDNTSWSTGGSRSTGTAWTSQRCGGRRCGCGCDD